MIFVANNMLVLHVIATIVIQSIVPSLSNTFII